VSETDKSVRRSAQSAGGHRAVPYLDSDEGDRDVGFTDALAWLSKHKVGVTALAMIVIQLVWKAGFLGQFYFRQDDIHFTELALRNSLSWSYLTYVGSGHLHPGVMLTVWILARTALYNWSAATTVLLAMIAIASVAAWWLLRTLIGNRPAILIPLALYLVTPLTFPNDSWWQSGIESAPLQAALFLALIAHVYYVRTGRPRYLVWAAISLAGGMFFFEKAAVIPVVLFGVTAGFLVEGTLASSARLTLVRYWRAWTVYGAMVVVYAGVLIMALHHSTVKPAPTSVGNAVSFAGSTLKNTLLPGLLGGPWRWLFTPQNAIGYSAAPSALGWLALLVSAAIIVASVRVRPQAWRAWALLGVWFLLADVAPVLLGRLSSLSRYTWVFELDTRYVADAAAVAAICVALAFWPIAQPPGSEGRPRRVREPFASQTWRVVGVGLTAVMVIGSVISVRAYEQVTSLANLAGQTFWDNAARSLAANLPPDSVIRNDVMPDYLMTHAFYENDALESAALGPLEGPVARKNARWIPHPSGTIDNFLIINGQGVLTRAVIEHGVHSVTVTGQSCWPFRKGRVTIPFTALAPATVGTLRIGYFAAQSDNGESVTVIYGHEIRRFTVQAPGLRAVYMPVTGSAAGVTLSVAQPSGLCIGDAKVGNLEPGFPLSLP
jgi:hypothetical protein